MSNDPELTGYEEPAVGPVGLQALLGRRSVAALTEPGPDAAQLDALLRAAATVPDHANLRPWRFVVVSGDGRAVLGEALARSAAGHDADISAAALERFRQKAYVAPTQILIVASPRVGAKVAEWEQVASAACTGLAITLAADALGLGAMWKSVPFTRGAGLTEVLGLGPDEQLLGWVNVGTPAAAPPPRRTTVDPADYTSVLTAGSPAPYRSPTT